MKYKSIKFFVMATVAIITTVAACKKDRTIVYINQSSSQSFPLEKDMDVFWKDQLPQVQKSSFNTSMGAWITGKSGSIVAIEPDAIVDAAGNLVNGTVDVEYIEYNTISDMAFSGVTTVSGTELLESGGMFYLNVKQNGKDLKFKSGKNISISYPQTNKTDDAMNFFTGNAKPGANKVDWVRKDTVALKPKRDSGSRAFFNINFNYFQFGYCNIDWYCNKIKTKCSHFKIKMPKHCNDTNSTALLMFKNLNCCAWCNWDLTEDCMVTHYTLPVGETIKVLVYRKTGAGEDDLEYGIVEYTLIDNSEVILPDAMTKTTKAGLAEIVKAL